MTEKWFESSESELNDPDYVPEWVNIIVPSHGMDWLDVLNKEWDE